VIHPNALPADRFDPYGCAVGDLDVTALRRAALVASLVRDIDLQPADDGVRLDGVPPIEVSWSECADVLGSVDPESPLGVGRIAGHLNARRRFGDLTAGRYAEPAVVTALARPVGLPVGHELHPGSAWTLRSVLGDALDLGLGVLGLDRDRPDVVRPLGPTLARGSGLDLDRWWDVAVERLERMGSIAAERWRRSPNAPLRPVGGCDVTTLLGSAALRGALAAANGGMCTCVVPMRQRGWTDLRKVDPAFAVAAAAAMPVQERGFLRPLLVTADEVAMIRDGGRPAVIALHDTAGDQPWRRPVPYT